MQKEIDVVLSLGKHKMWALEEKMVKKLKNKSDGNWLSFMFFLQSGV
jgi:hypothetical protein